MRLWWLRDIFPSGNLYDAFVRRTCRLIAAVAIAAVCFAPAQVHATETTKFSWSKSASDVVAAGDGTYRVDFTLRATNTGSDAITNLQIEDSLSFFGSGNVVSVTTPVLLEGSLELNRNYNGLQDRQLLTGPNELQVGQQARIRFTVTFRPGNNVGELRNRAVFRGTGEESGKEIDAVARAKFLLPIGLAVDWRKNAGTIRANSNGTFTAPITLIARNLGDEDLVNVVIHDSLDIFGDGELRAVRNLRVVDGNITLNPAYDGLGDTRILAGQNSLARGDEFKIRFDVVFDAGGSHGPFVNRASFSAEGKNSGTAVDLINPATIRIPTNPEVSWDSSIGDVVDNADGTFSALITLEAVNTGDEDLVDLQFKNDLDIFGSGHLVSVGPREILQGNLSLNPNYDGLVDIRLLNRTDTLPVGAAASIQFLVTFDPGDEPGPFENCALIWTEGAISGTELDLTDIALIHLPTSPRISLTKTAGLVTANTDGSYSVPISLTVLNNGNEDLDNLTVRDDYDIFRTGQLIAIESVDAPGLTVNPGFDGLTDKEILTGVDSLPLGETVQIEFVVRFDRGGESEPFVSPATAAAIGRESGVRVSDSDEVTFFVVITEPGPGISLDKQATEAVALGNGEFSSEITLTVTNTGDELLNAVQVSDPLNIFGSGELIRVENRSSATLSVDQAFDGATVLDLLDGSDSLAVAEIGVISFTVVFAPGAEPGPFLNSASAIGTGDITDLVVDDSDEAEIELTPPQPPPGPGIALDKQATEAVALGNGEFSSEITLTVTNTGDELLNAVQVSDPLNIFGSGELLRVENSSSATLSVDQAFDGDTIPDLLDGSDSLAVDEIGTITFTVVFAPGTEPGPFLNTATAIGTGDITDLVVDDSDEAEIELTPPQPPPGPGIALDKQATEAVALGNGEFSSEITLTVTNTGDELLNAVQVSDPLNIFGSGELLRVENRSSATLSVDQDFDGDTVLDLLVGTDSLAVAEIGVISFTVVFAPATEPGPFLNTATAIGTGDITDIVVDDSAEREIQLPAAPAPDIELLKEAGTVSQNDDGTESVPITLTVTNTGTESLEELQISDDLDIFGNGRLIRVESLVSSSLTVDSGYNGTSLQQILRGTDTLAVNESAIVTFDIRFDRGPEPGPFTNIAIANGTGEVTGEITSDTSEIEFGGNGMPRSSVIAVTKITDRAEVVRGGVVGYEVSVINLTSRPLPGVVVNDTPPAGFRFVRGSALLIRAGLDGLLGSADDEVETLGSNGLGPIDFDTFDLGPNERVIIRYATLVGVGVANGVHVNSVFVTPPPYPPESGESPITVVGDPLFENSTLIGKVFHDLNGNTYLDPGEPGIPGVRLATVSGLTMETDAEGRYHLADVEVERFERGANFIIKLDKATLPERAEVISENPRVMRLTQATMSKINFAVNALGPPEPICFESCATVTRQRTDTAIDPVPFVSGNAEIPDDFAAQLRQTLQRYRGERAVSIVFVGHADSDPVVGRLATQLGAGGEAGNVILSRNRAASVCRIVRLELNVDVDCDNVEGVGSQDPIASNQTEAGKALNRRVEIKIEFDDPDIGLRHKIVPSKMCFDQNASPYDPTWFGNLQSGTTSIESESSCIVHSGPLPDVEMTAEARRVTVSGGNFGCGTLVANTLPGRDVFGEPGINSEVTIYASTVGDEASFGETCPYPTAGNIVSGDYPVEVRTEAGSVLEVTGAGDVQRIAHPRNPNDFEHIIVTPIRDESEQTIITALRVTNDGIEPMRGRSAGTQPGQASSAFLRANADGRVADPRMDVLALDAAQIDARGFLDKPIRFAVFTNYGFYLNKFALEIYGRTAHSSERQLVETLPFTDWSFDDRHELRTGYDLSGFDLLEYVIKASNCDEIVNSKDCFVDMTRPRLIQIRDSGEDNDHVHEASEIWGETNLAVQRVAVRGGKVRVHCPKPGEEDQCVIDEYAVPAGKDRSKIYEEHLPPGTYTYRNDLANTVFELDAGDDVLRADANNITVSGGMFGCRKTAISHLPGRAFRGDVKVPAITITADPDWSNGKTSDCAGQSDIVVTTEEESVWRVTAAGDVRPDRYPDKALNLQQIVVTPYRDYTDPTLVSAIRIVNEGLQFEPADVPVGPLRTAERVRVDGDYSFLVVLANLTFGQNNLSGNGASLTADAHFDGSTFVDGRLAFYGKRKTRGYSLTAQLDSTEDELRNFSDNLKRKDPRRIFRQLDPNRYYPVYGDDSTTTTDVDTQGALYLRVDWDKNSALWGNYNTGITDTEFMQYNRSLYGARLKHESRQATTFGDAKTELTAFGSEAQSTAAHVTFEATGGSLYYLHNTDIVMGSEKVWVEVRRRDTQQVVERETLYAGRDYEIDPLQGRIILRQPLSQVVNDRRNSIIRSAPLEGDEVFLLVDYEYVRSAFSAEDLALGGRGHTWLGDHVGVGLTVITDERSGTDYEMTGVDLTLKADEDTYLRAEIADSTAIQSDANFLSADGGLSFASQVSAAPGQDLEGKAIALEGRVKLGEIGDTLSGDMHAWSKRREAGFSTGRLGQGEDINDSGIELQADLGANINLAARYTDFEREQTSRERVASIQADGTFDKFHVGLEVRHEDVDVQAVAPGAPVSGLNAALGDGEAVLIGARLGYDLGDDSSIYAAAQTIASDTGDYAENDLVSVGLNARMNDELALSAEVSDGDRGSALTGGIDYALGEGLNLSLSGGVGSGAVSQFATRYAIGDGHELYGSYAVDPDRTDGARNLLTVGQRRAFGNSLDIFNESQFGKDDRYAGVAHVFGMNFDGNDDWRYSASIQFSENNSVGLQFERQAMSFGAYRNLEDLKLSTRVEYREDEGTNLHNRQYVSSSSVSWLRDERSRWLGLLNFSWTDDELNGGRDARFAELDIGYAWRPVANDRFNLLGKYSFLYDLPTEGQASIRPDEKSHLLSVEGIYDLDENWELAGKIAVRRGERRTIRDVGPWQEFGLRLASVRARYHLTHNWDALAEYRWLSDINGDGDRHGALAAAYRHIADNFKVGVGYNFTDFDDRLRIDSYRNHGWFVDLVGKY